MWSPPFAGFVSWFISQNSGHPTSARFDNGNDLHRRRVANHHRVSNGVDAINRVIVDPNGHGTRIAIEHAESLPTTTVVRNQESDNASSKLVRPAVTLSKALSPSNFMPSALAAFFILSTKASCRIISEISSLMRMISNTAKRPL